jgi:hypothetical protein
MTQYSKESIIEILQNNSLELDEKTLQEMHNMIKLDPVHLKQVSVHLEKLGFVEHEFLARKICMLDYSGVLTTVIDKTIEEKDLPRQARFDLINLCHSKGIILGGDLLHFLLNFKPESNTHIGKGEALMRVLMKGTPTANGDLGASGKRFEIKFNKSRLRGMTGFDSMDASLVSKTLDEYFIHECDSIKFDARDLIGEEPGRWNFVSGKRIKPYLLTEIVKLSGMNPLYACKIFVSAFRKFFNNMTDDEALNLSYSLSKEFTPNGIKERLGYSDFIYKMSSYALKYYAKVEDFDGMIILNDQFDCMYITREFIDTNTLEVLSAFIRHNLSITTPNLGTKAGPQGSVFGIAL